MEKVIPLFTGVLGSLILCALIALYTNSFQKISIEDTEVFEEDQEELGSSFLAVREKLHDPVLEYYRNPEYQEWVVNFFAGICSNMEIAQAVLQNADEFNVPAALALALSWEESHFNPRAVNRHNRDGSIDRGLFQLNNRSFPNLELDAFFDVRINARYGISHLRHCLDFGGTEVSALAMYNAGTGRVNTSGAPRVTLNYISRILENRAKIEARFHTMLIKEEEARLLAEEKQTQNSYLFYFNRTLISTPPL